LNATVALRRHHLSADCVACCVGKPVADRLKARRIAAELLVKELARAAVVATGTVTDIEYGRVTPKERTVARLARVLGEL
jgi:predicted transcriptional regulator